MVKGTATRLFTNMRPIDVKEDLATEDTKDESKKGKQNAA